MVDHLPHHLLDQALHLLHDAKERVSVLVCWNGDWNSNTLSAGELVLSINVSDVPVPDRGNTVNASMRLAAVLPPAISTADISELRIYRMRQAYIPGTVAYLLSAAHAHFLLDEMISVDRPSDFAIALGAADGTHFLVQPATPDVKYSAEAKGPRASPLILTGTTPSILHDRKV